jgi:hypothetical protein
MLSDQSTCIEYSPYLSPIIKTVLIAEQSNFDIPSGISLGGELSLRNLRFTSVNGFLYAQMGRFLASSLGETTMADMETSTQMSIR